MSDISELRQEFADDTAEWREIREEGRLDMQAVAGDPWAPEDREAREKAGRFCLSLDELGQYINQVVNEIRANKRAVKFTPNGNGATDDTAEFYADKMREIEYRSRAQIAYTTAFENGVQRSYGFCRVTTRYESSRSVNQDIFIDAVHNPDLVTPDPWALMPDVSDMKHCWVRERWSLDDFNRKFPDHKLEGRAHTDLMRDASTWADKSGVWVSEYWKVKTKPRKLLVFQPAQTDPNQPAEPVGVFEDEIKGQPVPGELLAKRDVDDPYVCQQLVNGVDVLEETDWPGRYIPIVSCFGKVIYVDTGAGARRQILSMVRLARDPFMAYCFYRTCEMENVGMSTKNPYWAYEGQLSPAQMTAIAQSMHEPVAVLLAKPVTDATGPNILPHPVRNISEPAIQALSQGAEEMRRAIQSAMGQSPLPTSAQRRNEKSGVALKQIEETGQRGSFHFTDHYLDMVTQVGVIVEDLMDKIYDTARTVGVRKANESAENIRINDPNHAKSVNTKGDHLVTVSTGPSFESERDAASDFADTLAQTSPEIFALLGPMIVKLKNLGPIGDEMIELLEAIQPPGVKKPKDGEEPDPRQLQQQAQQMQVQMQQMQQALQQAQHLLETEQAKQQATIAKAKIDAEKEITIQGMRDATQIACAHIAAASKGAALDAHAAEEAQALGQQSYEADNARQHEAAMSAAEHEQALQANEQGHQQALEQGQQGAAFASQQLAQQAALQPPEAGA